MTFPLLAPMNFATFLAWSRRIHQDRPDVTALGETRIARALASIRPIVDVAQTSEKVHRCDLAREWCRVRGLSTRLGTRALVCRGVRHALAILFSDLARQGAAVMIPRDVYPVYWTIAAEAAVNVVGVATFPTNDLEPVFARAESENANHLLLPYPLKLQGRPWSDAEMACAHHWLARGADRRLLLDGVYSFGLPLGDDVAGFLATDQVVYLDSLSKGWLHEHVFGAAIVPERDFVRLAPLFRRESPGVDELRAATALLSTDSDFPERLNAVLIRRRLAVADRLASAGIRRLNPTGGYFLAVEGATDMLVEEHGLLTIPASVFGSDAPGWSIASALPTAAE